MYCDICQSRTQFTDRRILPAVMAVCPMCLQEVTCRKCWVDMDHIPSFIKVYCIKCLRLVGSM